MTETLLRSSVMQTFGFPTGQWSPITDVRFGLLKPAHGSLLEHQRVHEPVREALMAIIWIPYLDFQSAHGIAIHPLQSRRIGVCGRRK